MSVVVVAIVPIFILLLLGYIARATQFINDTAWVQIEKATYFVLFPCLLVQQLSTASIDWHSAARLMLVAALIPSVASVLAFGLKRMLPQDGASFTSTYQGAIRFNTYIGLALTLAVLPKAAAPLAALVIAVMVPWINVLCILVFARFAQGAVNGKSMLKQMARNPLILGCLIGIGLNVSGISLPVVINEVLKQLGSMTLPLGLLTVGAGLKWQALREYWLGLVGASVIKLALLPLIMAAIAYGLGLDHLSWAVVVVFAALPTASSAYILARQLGGNADYMAALITVQTLAALVTLPVVLAFVLR